MAGQSVAAHASRARVRVLQTAGNTVTDLRWQVVHEFFWHPDNPSPGGTVTDLSEVIRLQHEALDHEFLLVG
jgi:hypothetical protein